jgi:hypothetical protein
MRQRSAPTRHRRQGTVAAFLLAVTLAVTGLPGPVNAGPSAAPTAGKIVLKTLSNRADLVSDGRALVEVTLPRGVPASQLRLWLGSRRTKAPQAGDRDVTKAFAVRRDGKLRGLVAKLKVGKNVLSARLPDGRGAWLDITNHPNGGPVFSGPQLQPWTCQPGAVDKQCNQPATFSYVYKSVNPAHDKLQPYDPANPPSDVATTTTDEGVTVPFVVRVETGYQDRDQYRIGTLFQPGKPWTRWAPQQQWNNKVFVPHGGSCGSDRAPSTAPYQDYSGTFDLGIPGLSDAFGDSPTVALSRGFAVMSTALANLGHNCNVVTQAESLMMAKEHLVETYGDIRYTIGSGCSGGAIAQQTVANAYPGIYQGLIVTCSYPDVMTPGIQFGDYHLLRKYFESTERLSDGNFWIPLQWAAVEGHLLPLNPIVADEGLFKQAVFPQGACVSEAQRYHPTSNPGGTRCGIFDAAINVYGPRDRSVWTEQERKIGRGFAGLPVDNTGIQYGLTALQRGAITPAQFVDLNAKIGGLDIDINPTAKRTVADQPALQRMYRSGLMNGANNLDEVAIIDHRGPDPGLAHDARWAWAMRDRLMREQGHVANHVIWYGALPLIGDPSYSTQALLAMDRWLGSVEADKRAAPLANKIVQDRPADIHDRCTQTQGISTQDGLFLPVVDPLVDKLTGGVLDTLLNPLLHPVLDPVTNLVLDPVNDLVCGLGPVSDLVKTRFATPRIVAGDNNYSDNSKCQLRPLRRTDDYGVLGLTDAQWATMKKTFPNGVCDYSKPGVGKTDTVPWLSYEGKDGKVIYGGTPLPPRPRSTPFSGGQLSIPADPGSENGSGAGSGAEGSNVDSEPGQGNQVAPVAHVPASPGSPADTGGLLPQTGLSAATLRLLGAALALLLAGSVLLRRGRATT